MNKERIQLLKRRAGHSPLRVDERLTFSSRVSNFVTRALYFLLFASAMFVEAADGPLSYDVKVETPVNAPSKSPNASSSFWFVVHASVIPPGSPGAQPDRPRIVMTMQLQDVKGTHMYHGVCSMWSDDLGKTWHGPTPQPALDRRYYTNDLMEVIESPTPQWHTTTGKLLLTFF